MSYECRLTSVARFPGTLTLVAVKIGFTMWRRKGENGLPTGIRETVNVGSTRRLGWVTEFIEQCPCDRGTQI